MHLPVFLAGLTLFGFASSAYADDTPRRKAGLWEITTRSGDTAQSITGQQCVDAGTDELMRPAAGNPHCPAPALRREGKRTILDSTCDLNGTTITTHAEFHGDFSTDYSGEIASTFSRPNAGSQTTRYTIAARWLGPCRQGQRPGDIMQPGSKPMNIEDARRMMDEMRKRYQSK